MKKITAYKCDFCKRKTETKQAMKNHELKCFYNSLSKSCATCCNLTLYPILSNGNPCTELEERISQFGVPGTFTTHQNYDEDVPVDSYNELNDEYKYLYDVNYENYCHVQKIILKKLKTNCNYHAVLK